MQFFVIIPVFNSGARIAKTIQSILGQSALQDGSAELRCLVVDGASTDDTLDHVATIADPRIEVISEPDKGMYDALSKGLETADGDVTCYLPAGETFEPTAFEIVQEIFGRFEQVNWVTGRAAVRNAAGHIVDSPLPHPFKRHFMDCGMYGTRLDAVQQESTFWRSALNAQFDLDRLRKARLAGDYFMWRCLARKNELYVVNTHFASFTIEPGQLSKLEPGAYRKELRTLRRKPSLLERIHAVFHRLYTKRVVARKSRRLIVYDFRREQWHLARP